MAYIGVQPTDTYLSIASQQITGTGSATYTLDYSVSNEEDVAVFVNNVRQNVSTYTVSGTSLTLGGTISASDSCWVLFLGRTVGTKTPAVGSVTNDMLAGSIANDKLANSSITLNGTAVSLGGSATVGGTNTPAFEAHFTGSQGFSDATDHKVICTNEIYDSDSCYDTTTGRFTPTEAGRYVIYGQAYAGCGASNMYNHGTKIFKNGTAVVQSYIDLYTNTGNAGTEYISCVVYLNGSSDYVELYVQTDDTSGNPTLYSTVGNQATFFGGYKLIGA